MFAMHLQPPAPGGSDNPWRLFAWSLAGSPRLVLALAFALLGVVACEAAIPWLLAQVIDSALVTKDAKRVDHMGLVLIGVTAVLYVIHVGYLRAETSLVYRAMFRLRSLLCSRILEQPLDFFANAKTGELTHIVINDSAVLETHGVVVFSDLPFSVLTTLTITGLMFALDWRMALLVAVFLVIATVLSFRLGRPMPTLRKSIQKAAGRLSARLGEAVNGIRTVRALGLVDHERRFLDSIASEVASLEVAEGRLGAWVQPLLELMELLGLGLIVWFGAHRVLLDAMTPGTLVAFIAYMEFLSEPVSRAGRYVRHVQVCRGVMQRLDHFLVELAPAPKAGTLAPKSVPEVVFDNVSYEYPGADRPTLKNASFRVRPGEMVAIVGRNGAGKSTLVDILLGLRQPQHGEVRVADVRVADWEHDAWHRCMALMPQEVFLFHVTLAENIGYARLGATRGEIEKAAIAAGLSPLLQRLPGGLDTIVGDRGQRLSGGERQRVTLARVILREPTILVLDEPASALDGEAARELASLLRSLAPSRTTFVVAHRPEIVELASRVMILDAGHIAFDGARDEAMAHPLYRRLFDNSNSNSNRHRDPQRLALVPTAAA